MSMIVLCDDYNFGGGAKVICGDAPDLRNAPGGAGAGNNMWNDRASSCVVVEGTWELYNDIDFGGPRVTLSEGFYPKFDGDAGVPPNDWVSSVKAV